MAELNIPPPIKPPSHETAEAFSGEAVYSNKFYVHMAGMNGRLTFAELPPDGLPPVFRTAVSMALPDLLILADLIQKVAKEHTEKNKIKIEFGPPPNA